MGTQDILKLAKHLKSQIIFKSHLENDHSIEFDNYFAEIKYTIVKQDLMRLSTQGYTGCCRVQFMWFLNLITKKNFDGIWRFLSWTVLKHVLSLELTVQYWHGYKGYSKVSETSDIWSDYQISPREWTFNIEYDDYFPEIKYHYKFRTTDLFLTTVPWVF